MNVKINKFIFTFMVYRNDSNKRPGDYYFLMEEGTLNRILALIREGALKRCCTLIRIITVYNESRPF